VSSESSEREARSDKVPLQRPHKSSEMSGIDPSWMVRNGFGHSSLHWPGIQPNSTVTRVMDTQVLHMTAPLADNNIIVILCYTCLGDGNCMILLFLKNILLFLRDATFS